MLLVDAGARDFDRRKGLHAASAPWIGNHVFLWTNIWWQKSCTKICISCKQWDNLIHQENYLSTFAELLPLTVKHSCHPAPHAVRGALPFHGVCGTRECCPIHTFSQWLVGGQFPLLGSCASNNPFHRGFLGE